MKRSRPGRGWAYVCAQLGGVASIAANVAHSFVPPEDAAESWSPPVGAVISSVFWPVALFAAIEAFSRVPWPEGKRWVWLRFGGLLPVAAVAAVVSYMHLSGLLDSYGAGGFEVHVGPLAVDGLMVIGTAALIATSRTRPASEPEQVDLDEVLARHGLDQVVEAEVQVEREPTWSVPVEAIMVGPDYSPADPWRYAEPIAEGFVQGSSEPPDQVDAFVREAYERRVADRTETDPVGMPDGREVDQVAARRKSDDELWTAHGDELCRAWIDEGGISRYRVEVVTGAARRQAERLLARVEQTVEQAPAVTS